MNEHLFYSQVFYIAFGITTDSMGFLKTAVGTPMLEMGAKKCPTLVPPLLPQLYRDPNSQTHSSVQGRRPGVLPKVPTLGLKARPTQSQPVVCTAYKMLWFLRLCWSPSH